MTLLHSLKETMDIKRKHTIEKKCSKQSKKQRKDAFTHPSISSKSLLSPLFPSFSAINVSFYLFCVWFDREHERECEQVIDLILPHRVKIKFKTLEMQ